MKIYRCEYVCMWLGGYGRGENCGGGGGDLGVFGGELFEVGFVRVD